MVLVWVVVVMGAAVSYHPARKAVANMLVTVTLQLKKSVREIGMVQDIVALVRDVVFQIRFVGTHVWIAERFVVMELF